MTLYKLYLTSGHTNLQTKGWEGSLVVCPSAGGGGGGGGGGRGGGGGGG